MVLFQAILSVILLGVLISICVIDTRTRRIPNALALAVLACGIAAIWVFPYVTLQERVIGLVAVSAPMLLLDFLAKDAFGLGDVKLMAAAGFLLGWYGALVAAFIGLVVGGVYGIFLIVVRHKGRKSHFAFGPALCIGICVSYAGLMV